MNEKGANIDLLFRNGLKDFEVLPPPGVWDGVHSAVKIKSRPVILLRIAAVVTVLLTVSFLTYRWSREISGTPEGPAMTFNVPVSSPIISQPFDNPKYLTALTQNRVKDFSYPITENDNQGIIPEETESTASPEQNINFLDTKGLSINTRETGRRPYLTPLNTFQGNSFKIEYPDLKYFPEEVVSKPQNRWSIAAMASPTYYSNFNSGSDELSKQLMASEQPVISYSGGVAFSYKISKRFSVQSGLYYSSLGQKVDGISSFSGFQPYGSNTKGDHNFEVLTSSGTVVTSNPDVFLSADGSERIHTGYTIDVFDPKKASLQPVNNSLSQNFSYLELPVVLRYKIVDKTFGINLIGGLSYNMLINNTVYTTVDGNRYSVGRTEGLNPLSLSSSLGMGMEYNLSNKLSLNLEPTFRYYLNPFSVTTGSFIHPYSFGIFSGVSYKF
jgi:Outer membrane protein beta-barrel domain